MATTGEEKHDAHKELPVDVSLFQGLEAGMTVEEQQQVTQLMTSGDPAQLAQAATILSGIADLCKAGVSPSQRSESQTASLKALHNTSYTNNVLVRQALLEGQHDIVRRIRVEEAEVKERRRMYPLPPRMPRYARIKKFDPTSSEKRDGIKGIIGIPSIPKTPIGKGPLGRKRPPSLFFVDDTWDGSVIDAFSEIKLSNGTVRKVNKESPGVSHIMGAARIGEGYKTIMDEPQPRVLISESHNDASKNALQKGDVVTHIDGKAFVGTAHDLVAILADIYHGAADYFDIVVNAEACTAEALRLRATC
eukprot:CAMPEP_0185724164 /NCGR_PEP_ID=MMETSP1171-20130828/723_1 /TAXON_ID=374046 /ORGANISM="Helicotheca tamensis, Strain CCMP826" /LENGTH=305 /DNA_ID=CAMNT_0028391949 /DNA_START=62 /DNA_END=979 /DNA_ORIENTATION=-